MVLENSRQRRKTKHFLVMPPDCPMSDIVYGEGNDYKCMAKEIYLKYIKSGSIHEINLVGTTRKKLANLMDNNWSANEVYEDSKKLFFLFDECLHEMHSLVNPSFCRFRDSNSYKLIQVHS